MEDSDEEKERSDFQVRTEDDLARRRAQQASIDTWLKREIVKLKVAEAATSEQDDWIYGSHARWIDKELASVSGDKSNGAIINSREVRDVSSEERGALAMLMALSHFEEGSTNLHLHIEIRNHVGSHQWMEDDPGAVELLCRVHNNMLAEVRASGLQNIEDSPENEMRKKIISAVNVLVAPGLAECSGGLREFMPQICTEKPSSDITKEWKEKYHRQDYGKQAVIASLCPDIGGMDGSPFITMLCYVFLFVAIIVLLILGG
eukprot:CAMPEP_0178379346 /NCGR_PEP_ID=MMETSP0689_2-20121128/4895_1 /TAXON_ID=160604 /ORGANISM="Amphidinium massartii, Strain CS-259" /LENGTH=260 /DNA_ID=CAMNT_0019999445 /DNA_START=1 /DNA_END=780 /DNA_ORIENTATION=-